MSRLRHSSKIISSRWAPSEKVRLSPLYSVWTSRFKQKQTFLHRWRNNETRSSGATRSTNDETKCVTFEKQYTKEKTCCKSTSSLQRRVFNENATCLVFAFNQHQNSMKNILKATICLSFSFVIPLFSKLVSRLLTDDAFPLWQRSNQIFVTEKKLWRIEKDLNKDEISFSMIIDRREGATFDKDSMCSQWKTIDYWEKQTIVVLSFGRTSHQQHWNRSTISKSNYRLFSLPK